MREIDQNAFQEELPAELFIDLDNDVITTVPISCDEDIFAKISDAEEHNEIDEDINEVDINVERPNLETTLRKCSVKRMFLEI